MRRRRPIRRIPRPVVWTLVAGLALGAIARGAGAASLSDAARETAKPTEHQRVLEAAPRENSDDGGAIGILIAILQDGDPPVETRETGTGTRAPSTFRNWRLGGVMAAGVATGAEFAPSVLYGVQAGIEPWPRTRLDLVAVGGTARFASGSDLAPLLVSPGEVAAALELRHVIGAGPMAPTIEPLVGFRIGHLSWRYRNGILVDRGGPVEEVDGDGLTYYAGYGGVGLTLLRAGPLELGWTVIAGLRIHEWYSDQGLRNDLFGRSGFAEMRMETRITF